MFFTKLFTSRITIVLSFLLLAAGLIAGITLIRYPQILFPEAAGECPGPSPFMVYCTWDPVAGALSYGFQVDEPSDSYPPSDPIYTTNTYFSFEARANHTYVCYVHAVNDCGNKSVVAESAPWSCTAPVPPTPTPTSTPVPTPQVGCENCVGGIEKRYPASVWDRNGNGIIDDCTEACLAYFGEGCSGWCANPGSTDPAKCCGCECPPTPTPGQPKECNCRPVQAGPPWPAGTTWGCRRLADCDPGPGNTGGFCLNCEGFDDYEFNCCLPKLAATPEAPSPTPACPAGCPSGSTSECRPYIYCTNVCVWDINTDSHKCKEPGAGGAPDVNDDGYVDGADASVLVANWGIPFGFDSRVDLNNDGKVNAIDASILMSNWKPR